MRLLAPYRHAMRHRFFSSTAISLRSLAIFLLGAAILLGLYSGSVRTLGYFHGQDELGIILSIKILQMIWILLFAMLIFSAMVTAVSTMYLSKDNEIIIAAPIAPAEIFQMRLLTTTISTSWMVTIFSLPVFAAYGTVFEAGPLFFPLMLFALFAVVATGSVFALALTIVIVYLFPAKRTKDIILYLSLCFGLFLYLIFRLIRPEELVNPDQYGQFIEYFSAISAPAGPWLPAGWAANLLAGYLLDLQIDWLIFALLLTTPIALFILGEMAMERFFQGGFSKSQESFGGHRSFTTRARYSSPFIWFARKELYQFTRDSAQWSQLFMIAALVVVYLYNFKALPLERSPLATVYITNLIAFANIGLTGFLAASLATRFVYPSIGAERGAYYLIASAPLSLGQFFWYKFCFYALPFTLLTILLVGISNHLLQVAGEIRWISFAASLLMVWTILGMGLGFGGIFVDFKSENKDAALGPGAVIFLFSAIFYLLAVLALGVAPTYHLIRNSLRGGAASLDYLLVALWLTGAALVSALLVILLLRAAKKRLRG